MNTYIIYKVKGLFFFLFLLIPVGLYPIWEQHPSSGSTIFEKKKTSSEKRRTLFSNEYAEEKQEPTGFEFEKDGEENAYAPPPGIDDDSDPQKILPLKGKREIPAMLFLAAGFILIGKIKRKEQIR